MDLLVFAEQIVPRAAVPVPDEQRQVVFVDACLSIEPVPEIVKEQISFDDPERSFLFQCDLCLKMPSPIFNINFVYIMDRCAYDYIVYTSLHFYRLPDELKKQYISKYVESILYCRYLLLNVNCIFLTHADDRSIENDNFRPTIYNELRTEEINLFSTLIDSVNKKYCFLPNDIDNQIFTIENFIKREL